MPLSSPSLSGKIKANIISFSGQPASDEELQKLCDAIAQAVVSEITSSAIVNTGISVDPNAFKTITTGTIS